MNGDVSFNSNDLQTYDPTTNVGIITNLLEHTDIPEQVGELFAIADADGSSIPSINYPSKRIPFGGAIKGSSQDDLDARIDTFKGYFNGKNKNLDIDYAGTTRRYIATKNSLLVRRQQTALFATFTGEFVCTRPFGIETSITSITNTLNHTSATLTVTPTIGGSAPYQYPIFTITIDAVTGTGDYIQLTNDNNGQDMLLFGLGLTGSDVLVIDCAERTVTVNGNIVDYRGTFLELEPGANSITYTDGFTTRTVDIVAGYYKRYL